MNKEHMDKSVPKVIITFVVCLIIVCVTMLYADHAKQNDSKNAMAQHAVAFYSFQDDIPEENGFYAAFGLTAPSYYGEDVYEWAKSKIMAHHRRVLQKKLTDDEFTQKIFELEAKPLFTNGEFYSIQGIEYLRIDDDALTLKGRLYNEKCWFEKNKDKGPDCLSEDRVQQLIKDNALLLTRYRKISNYRNYVNVPCVDENFKTYSNVHTLFLLDLILKSRVNVNADDAAREWIQNTRYIRHVLTDKNDAMTRAKFLLLYRRSLTAMPIIFDSPDLVRRHKDDLLELLTPFGLQQMHLDQMNQANALQFRAIFDHLNATDKDRLYRQQNEFLAIAFALPKDVFDKIAKYREKYAIKTQAKMFLMGMVGPLGGHNAARVFAREVILAHSPADTVVIIPMHEADIHGRLLNLYVRWKANKISSSKLRQAQKDGDMSQYDPKDVSFYSAYPAPNGEAITIDASDADAIISYKNTYMNISIEIPY